MPDDTTRSTETLDVSQISAHHGKDLVGASSGSVAAILKRLPGRAPSGGEASPAYSTDSRGSGASSPSAVSSSSSSASFSTRRRPKTAPEKPSAFAAASSSSTPRPTVSPPGSRAAAAASPAPAAVPPDAPVAPNPTKAAGDVEVEGEVVRLRAEVARQRAEITELKEENFMWGMKGAQTDRTALRLSISHLKFDDAVQVCTKEEFEALRRDVVQQDALINGYQKENEKLTLEVKDLRKQLADAKGAMYATLAKRPNVAHEEGPAASLQAQEWRLKYERLAKEMDVREGEWRADFEALKRQKKEMETRLAGIDREKNCNDELEIRRLTAELKQQEVRHKNQVDALESQIRWYVENQELVTKGDDLIATQAQTIDNLRQRILELEGGARDPGRGDAASRLRQSQRRVAELEEALRRAERGQKDDGITALIRAVKPTTEESQQMKVMQRRMQQLQQELDEQTAKSEKALRVLRLEADKLKASYERRIAQMDEDLKIRLKAASSKKAEDLGRQLEEMRAYYTKKVKELETQVVALRRDAKGPGRGGRGGPGGRSPTFEDGAMPPATSDSAHKSQGTQTPAAPASPTSPSPAGTEGELRRLQAEVARLTRRLAEDRPQSPLPHHDAEAALDTLRHQVAAAHAEAAAQRQVASRAQDLLQRAQLEQTERLGAVLREHQETRDKLVQQHRQELARVEREYTEELRAVRERLQMVGGVEGPGDRVGYLRCVASRLEALEQHCWLREREVQRTLEETRRMADFELQVEKQKVQLLLEAKNNEIERFRLELDALMEQFHAMANGQVDPG